VAVEAGDGGIAQGVGLTQEKWPRKFE
jgi:hypothetical protein